MLKRYEKKKADYVLSLKGNQSSLHDDIALFLSNEIDKLQRAEPHKIKDRYEDYDKGHGRIEHRLCYVTDELDWLEYRGDWCDLKSIAMVESRVSVGDKSTTEQRYFISSLPPNAKELAQAIRSHWAIENSLHWVLDVTLGEDLSRVRKDHAPENMAIVRHIVLNLLRSAKSQFRRDLSLKGLQKKAGWGETTLSTILMQEF